MIFCYPATARRTHQINKGSFTHPRGRRTGGNTLTHTTTYPKQNKSVKTQIKKNPRLRKERRDMSESRKKGKQMPKSKITLSCKLSRKLYWHGHEQATSDYFLWTSPYLDKYDRQQFSLGSYLALHDLLSRYTDYRAKYDEAVKRKAFFNIGYYERYTELLSHGIKERSAK